MIGYASHTTTKRNLAVLRAHGWRLLIAPTSWLSTAGVEGFQYGIDNGAWTAHIGKTEFDGGAFEALLGRFGAGADFIVLPDIVAGGLASLRFSLSWRERVAAHGPLLLLPVQDGMTPSDVAPLLALNLGIFVGGSTEWKIATMPTWGALARDCGCWCHVGRVNTARRIRMCAAAGATSFDGSSASRFSVNTRPLDLARRQDDLFPSATQQEG